MIRVGQMRQLPQAQTWEGGAAAAGSCVGAVNRSFCCPHAPGSWLCPYATALRDLYNAVANSYNALTLIAARAVSPCVGDLGSTPCF